MKAGEILAKMSETYIERNALYKDNYKRFGDIMLALYPEGLTLKTKDEWNRICIFMMITSKLTRYAANFEKGGHQDSIHDTGVYAAMLEELGCDAANKDQCDKIIETLNAFGYGPPLGGEKP